MASGVTGSCVRLPAAKRMVICRSLASGRGEADGTREGAEGIRGKKVGTSTSLDLTCLFGLEECGTGGGGEATATRLYIAAPVNGLGAATGAEVTVVRGAGGGAVEAPEGLFFLDRRRERFLFTSVNPEAEDSPNETFLSAVGGGQVHSQQRWGGTG